MVVADELLINDIFQSKEKKSKDREKNDTASAAAHRMNPTSRKNLPISMSAAITASRLHRRIRNFRQPCPPAEKPSTSPADRIVKISGARKVNARPSPRKKSITVLPTTPLPSKATVCVLPSSLTRAVCANTFSQPENYSYSVP